MRLPVGSRILVSHGIGAVRGCPFATNDSQEPRVRVAVVMVSDGVEELADLLVTVSLLALLVGTR